MNEQNEKNKSNYRETFKNLRLFWKYAKKHKKYLAINIFVILLLIVVGVILPLLSAKLILNITNGILAKVLIVATVVFVLEISRNVFMILSQKLLQLFYLNTLNDLQVSLAHETLKLDVKEFDHNSSGIFIDRLSGDAASMANIFETILFNMSHILQNIGVLGAIFIVDRIMFIYVIVILLLSFGIEKIRIKCWYDYTKEVREIEEKNSGLIAELVRGVRDIKVLNSTNDFMKKVMKRIKEANTKQYKLNTVMRRYDLFSWSIRDLSSYLFILLGIILVSAKELTIDNFIVIYMYQSQAYNLLFGITNLIEEFKNFSLSSGRVFEIINGKFSKEKFGAKHLDKIKGDFEFKNVNFSYDGKKQILKDLSFKVKANETVAFVGKSGGGKTTIFNLIDRLYNVDSGKITIDGINVNELDKNSIRDNISIITQSPYIFNFSIKENLKITKSNATNKEIIEACKVAQLHDYIMTLPDKYDTVVGEGGITLSGGQRQRLAIARALLKKTEIILFDEATSALDNETQKSIQTAINNMKGEYTILIIAHRLSTVIGADRLLLINDGKIEAEGTHQELLKNSKAYQELYKSELD